MAELFFQGLTAVVGATDNVDKFGYKIYKSLQSKYVDIQVVPINPRCSEIDGVVCKSSIADITRDIDTVVFIVNPTIGFELAKVAYDLGVRKFWFQPGADSDELRAFCEEKGVLYSIGMCILHI